jgi:catechol 2,3-dioxygenase-like lactoylglutathione lyase family enzyme
MPKLTRVLETALYCADLDRAAAFYGGVLGLPCIHEDHRMRAYDVGGNGVLLLFPRVGRFSPSKRLEARSLRTTATAPCTSPFQSQRASLMLGSGISRKQVSHWKVGRSGRGVG